MQVSHSMHFLFFLPPISSLDILSHLQIQAGCSSRLFFLQNLSVTNPTNNAFIVVGELPRAFPSFNTSEECFFLPHHHRLRLKASFPAYVGVSLFSKWIR